MFSVGDRVVCVDASKLPHTTEELAIDCPNWVKKGAHYTIRQIVDLDFVVGVLLEEIKNPMKYFRVINKIMEPTFKISRFEKLKEDEKMAESLIEEIYIL